MRSGSSPGKARVALVRLAGLRQLAVIVAAPLNIRAATLSSSATVTVVVVIVVAVAVAAVVAAVVAIERHGGNLPQERGREADLVSLVDLGEGRHMHKQRVPITIPAVGVGGRSVSVVGVA